MKMISSTSITSTKGVTLMSAFWRMCQALLDWAESEAAICDSMLSYTCKLLQS